MTLISYVAPSGRGGTYETNGGDSERIKALTSLLCMSLTQGESEKTHLDNLFQAAVCLKAELADIDTCDDEGVYWAVEAVKTALDQFVNGTDDK